MGTGSQSYPACQDVYEWEANGTGSCHSEGEDGGCLYLLSTGKSSYPSFLSDASATGDDVFLFTRSQLVGQDRDQLLDLYDARVGGGLPAQNPGTPAPQCEAEGCKPGASPPPQSQSPGTSGFSGPGDKKPPRHRKHHKRKHRRVHHHRRHRRP